MDPKAEGEVNFNVKCSEKDIKKSKKSKKSKKRKYSSNESESDTSPKRLKSKKHKKKCKKKHKYSKDKKHKTEKTDQLPEETDDTLVGPEVPKEILEKSQSMAPLSKEDWEKKQNTIKRVFDKTTGRSRLIRGDGEIIEEIVSRERHQAINRLATQGDGDFFQSNIKNYV